MEEGEEKTHSFLSTLLDQILTSLTLLVPDFLSTAPLWVHIVLLTLLLVPMPFILFKIVHKIRSDARHHVKAVKEFVVPSQGPRFRKRDKIEFMSRRVFRNAKAVGSLIRGGQGRKRKAMAKLVKKVFSNSSKSPSQTVIMPGLPDEYLAEEDDLDLQEDTTVPRTLLLVLKSLRVFGHFDNKIFVELMKNIEYITLRQHDSLFKIGEADENMYIVDSGSIQVYSTSRDPRTNDVMTTMLKTVGQGEAIFSLLSFIEYLGGRFKTYKTVSARATRDTRIIRFAFKSFKAAFDKYPENLSKVVQVVMVRLQRVTLLALHQYLGLGAELLTHNNRGQMPNKDDEAPEADLNTLLVSQTVLKAKRHLVEMNDLQLKNLAVEVFLEILSLTDEQLQNVGGMEALKDAINICHYDEGQVLVQEDSNDHPALLLILQGTVGLSQKSAELEEVKIHKAHVGGVICQLQTLTFEPSFFTARCAVNQTKVAALDGKFVHDHVMGKYPHVALRLAVSVIDNLSPYVRSIDFALEWHQLESGKALYKQNQEADSTYVVLSGRLRSVITISNRKMLVAEYGRGDLTGIVETLLKTRRKTTVMAVRDTEVAKIPAGLIDAIKTRYPVVLLRLLKLLGEKLQQSWEDSSDMKEKPLQQIPYYGNNMTAAALSGPQTNFSTVAVIGLSPNIPTSAFCMELLHPLIRIDPALRLTREYILEELGVDAFEKTSDFRLTEWLAQQEDNHRIVLYQCEPELNMWTRLCIRHADVIFILTDPNDNAQVKGIERDLESLARRTRKEMIFLHGQDTKYPEGTSVWLKQRNWVNAHYHIKCPRRMTLKKTKYAKLLNGPPPDVHSDFSRLARYITGESVGLVLGGGGARGCSHVGMIKATLEAGIPIDHVAGVSIGALIGGLYCLERDLTEVTVKARKFSSTMVQYWRQAFDLTCPYTSYFTGHCFNRSLEGLFGDHDILDLWLPYFTVTTDITCSAMRVHDYGSLWRYVRASMSLAGYLPPLCDPHDGHLLLDGGYTNNLPADIMKTRGAKHILAVDVGAQDDVEFTNFGDSLNGWKVLLSKWNPFSTAMNVPSQAEIQSRLAYVSCVGKLETVKTAGYCEYIRPPIDKYGTLQFGLFDEIKEVGYRHGETFYKGFKKAGLMKLFYWWNPQVGHHPHLPGMIRRGSLSGSTSNLLASSLESDQNSPTQVPTHLPLEKFEQKSQLSELAKMVCAVRSPTVRQNVDDFEMGGEGELVYTDGKTKDPLLLSDEDSDNLISDEEDDNESGFLSQI